MHLETALDRPLIVASDLRSFFVFCLTLMFMMGADVCAASYVVDLSKEGVVCDGVTDNAPIINMSLDKLRKSSSPYAFNGRIVFPPGDCIVRSSLNFTNLKSKSLIIDGSGARVIGHIRNGVIFDALGSQFLKIRDLTIVGNADEEAKIGLLIGRTSDTPSSSSDNIYMDGVSILGNFSLAALYNLNSETSLFLHLNLVNSSQNMHSFTLIQDGINHFGVESLYALNHQKKNHDQSFNENLFINCDIRHNGEGTPVWISHATRHEFSRSYVAALKSSTGMIIYAESQAQASTQLKIDIHFETKTLRTAILFSGNSSKTLIRGLAFSDQYAGAQQSVFDIDGPGSLEIQNIDLDLPALPQSAILFGHPDQWKLSGRVYIGDTKKWNIPPTMFSGLLSAGGDMLFFGKVMGK